MRSDESLDPAACWALLGRAPVVHLCLAPGGRPRVRPVHGVVVDGALCLHGRPRGEKAAGLGAEVLVCAHELVAEIPSYFLDPERACPATTLYESVELRGILEEVVAPARKAEILQALMARYQPEGGHAPITADDPLYRAAVGGVGVLRVRPGQITGKRKLFQARRVEQVEAVLQALWRRGRPGDPPAIERVRAAHPGRPRPRFLCAPRGLTLCCAPGSDDLAAAASLVRAQYWTEGVADERIARAHASSDAWVGARDTRGALVATARAIGDGGRLAVVLDVAVRADLRGQGVGSAVVGLLLDHPRLRDVARIGLRTRDAHDFYARFGFDRCSGDGAAMERLVTPRP